MTSSRIAQAWRLRPRWVLTRALRTVKPMNTERVLVRGARRFEPGESLYSVGFHGELRPRFWQLPWYLVAPNHSLVPRDVVLGGLSENEFESSGHELTRMSRMTSVYAATRWLGLAPDLGGQGAVVTALQVGGPCDGLLSPGDVVVSVNGRRVDVVADFTRALASSDVDAATLEIICTQSKAGGGSSATVELPLTDEDGARRPLGLKLATHRVALDAGLDVELLDDPDSSGPSAGLVNALAVIDVLTPGRLTGGLKVAATGTIDPHGSVGEVAWIGMKALAAHRAGMDLLLVPRGARREALHGLPKGHLLRVVEVGSLDAAVTKLVALGGDRPERLVAA